MEKYLADFIQSKRASQSADVSQQKILFVQRLKGVTKEARNITKKIIPYVLLGVAVGAVIHGFVPTGFFEHYVTKSNPFAVPIAVIA